MIGYSTVTQKGQVTIPVAIRRLAGIDTRQQVMIAFDQNSVKITPAKDVSSLRGSIKPRSRPENFKKMRQEFIHYLSERSSSKHSRND